MIMHSSWFRRPVYKKINLAGLIMAVSGLFFLSLTPLWWLIPVCVFILWLLFSALASYFINSGVYVSTICKIITNEKLACLTFDDGPCETTPALLSMLKEHNAKATFFITGSKVEGNEKILGRIVSEGHETGNHSYSHKKWFPLMRVRKIRDEIKTTQLVISKATGYAPIYFRPPYGVTNPLIARALTSFGLITIGWSIRSMDTMDKSASDIVKKITKNIHPGSIVLLHDTSNHVRTVLEQVLVYCKSENYKFVTISELLETEND